MRKKSGDESASILRSVATLFSGVAGAQIVALLFMPLITRMYGPENIGLLGVFNSFVLMFTPIAALAYPMAVLLPKSKKESIYVAQVSVWLSLWLSTVAGFSAYLFFGAFSEEGATGRAVLSFLVSVGVLFGVILQVSQQLALRDRGYGRLSLSSISQSVVANLGKTTAGVFLANVYMLVVMTVLSSVLSLVFLIKRKVLLRSALLITKISPRRSWIRVAGRYRDFPLYRAPEVFLSAATKGLPLLIFAKYYGATSAGYLAIALSVLSIPQTLYSKSIGEVFYQRAAAMYRDRSCLFSFFLKTTVTLVLISFLSYIPVILFGPQLFSLVFGESWSGAGEYARWLSLWFVVLVVSESTMRLIPVLREQRFFLQYRVVVTVLSLSSLALSIGLGFDEVDSLVAYSLIRMVLTLLLVFYGFTMSRRKIEVF